MSLDSVLVVYIVPTVQRKILVGENFGEFGDLLRIRQSFIRQLLLISEKAIEAGLNPPKFSSPNAI